MGQSQCHSSLKNSSVLYLATLILTSTKMPPVEIESVPLPVDAHAEIGIHLKIVDKATTIPLVNDAVTAVTPIITEAVTAATNLHTQVREANTVYNTVEDLILGGIKEATPTLTESVPEVVKTTLATTVGQLDTLACDGLDKLTTTIPQLNEPTQEIITNTTEIITNTTGEIVTVVNDVTDYVTSFNVAQWGLKTADKALSVTEKILHTLEPSDDPDTPLSPIFSLPLVATVLSCVKPTVATVRALRRYLRALRHGGRRLACATADVTTIGWFLETFYINILLTTVFGIRIAPLCETTTDELPLATSGKRKTPEPEDAEEETVVMLSDEKIAEYDEAQDPDYEPTEEETPVDPLEYDSAAEIADEEVTEGTTVEEVEEETVEAAEESQEIVTEESSQEGTVEDDACNTPACEKVVVEGKHVVVEDVKPMGTLEDETTGEVEDTTNMAEEVHTTETTDVNEEVHTTETTDMMEEVHATETTETTDMTEEVIATETTDMTEEVLTTETTDMLTTETTDITEEVPTTVTTDVTGEVVTETTGEEVHTTNTTEMTGEMEHATDMEATS